MGLVCRAQKPSEQFKVTSQQMSLMVWSPQIGQDAIRQCPYLVAIRPRFVTIRKNHIQSDWRSFQSLLFSRSEYDTFLTYYTIDLCSLATKRPSGYGPGPTLFNSIFFCKRKGLLLAGFLIPVRFAQYNNIMDFLIWKYPASGQSVPIYYPISALLVP